jgi:hypothetical protein
VENIVRALAIQCEATKAKLREDPESSRIAPWHFPPKFREYKESSGSWSIVKYSKEQVFKDEEGKDWKGYPPPTYGPKQFIEQEIDGPRRPSGQDKWALEARGISLLLPSWMQEMAKKESKTAADKKGKKQFTATDANREIERWKARFLQGDGQKDMLREKLTIVEDLMSDDTCENLQLKLMVEELEGEVKPRDIKIERTENTNEELEKRGCDWNQLEKKGSLSMPILHPEDVSMIVWVRTRTLMIMNVLKTFLNASIISIMDVAMEVEASLMVWFVTVRSHLKSAKEKVSGVISSRVKTVGWWIGRQNFSFTVAIAMSV